MKKLIIILTLTSYSEAGLGQNYELVNNKALKFSIVQEKDTIDFIVVDTLVNERKPMFLWCQGSMLVPFFCEIEYYGYSFLEGEFQISPIQKSISVLINKTSPGKAESVYQIMSNSFDQLS